MTEARASRGRASERAVVTGGCGFIGSHLVRRLAADRQSVVVIDDLSNGSPDRLPPGVELRRGDVADATLLRETLPGATAVFHLAAVAAVQRSNEAWAVSHATNSGGTVAVLEAIRDVAPEAVLVYASSAAVYGDERAENGTPLPLTPYGIDKLASELHAAAGGRLFGIRSFGLRFFNVYGPGQAADSPYSGVISCFVEQARRGGPLTIFGDGCQTRDFVYVEDVVDALVAARAAAAPNAPIADVATGSATTILDLAATIRRLVDPRVGVAMLPDRPGDIRHSLGDPAAAARLLGWRARTALDDGLARLVGSEAATPSA